MRQVAIFAKRSRLATIAFLCAAFTLSILQYSSIQLLEFLRTSTYLTITSFLLIALAIVCIAVIVGTIIKWAEPESRGSFIRQLLLIALIGIGTYLVLGIVLGFFSLMGGASATYRIAIHIVANITGVVIVSYLTCLLGTLIQNSELRVRVEKTHYLSALALATGSFVALYALSYMPQTVITTIIQGVGSAIASFILLAFAATVHDEEARAGKAPQQEPDKASQQEQDSDTKQKLETTTETEPE